jgi:nucleoside-triphosphatase THEP1
MASASKRQLLVTGRPACGKTTLVNKIAAQLKKAGYRVQGWRDPAHVRCAESIQLRVHAGFYTEEVRDDSNQRIGFDVVTLDGLHASFDVESFQQISSFRSLCRTAQSFGAHQ